VKIQVERDQLAEAVAWTARALPARPTAPVLAGIRINAGPAGLGISAFDYEVSAQAAIPVAADEPGTVLVSGKLLNEIIKSMPNRPVQMSTDGTRMTVRCGSAVFTLMLLPADEFPTLPGMPAATGTIGANTFATAVSQVAIAAGKDDTLPALTGVRAELDGDTITLVATDRYRLAVRTLRWNPAVDGLDTAVLVPARVLTDTARALTAGAEVTVGLAATDDHPGDGIIGFEGGGRMTTTRLLAGEYPKYHTLMPAEFSARAEIPAAPFADAVKRVALVAERNTPIRLTFAPGEVLLEAGTGDEAQATESIEAAAFDGNGLQVAFNPQYLLDGINAAGSDIACISFTTPTRPAVITGKTEDPDPDYRYIIMPIRSAG
jgi:DNA polymerase-3 subunit beta